MTHIAIVPPDEGGSEVTAIYASDLAKDGYIWNLTKAFSHRPDVLAAWRGLVGTISGHMDLRTYELATVAAARRRRSSYCSLAHGRVLASRFHTPQEVVAIVTGAPEAPLDDRDRAVMAFADLLANDPTAVTAEDVARLRSVGLDEADIFDLVAAVAARAFLTTLLDGLGVLPDASFLELDPVLRETLTVGRPIDAE